MQSILFSFFEIYDWFHKLYLNNAHLKSFKSNSTTKPFCSFVSRNNLCVCIICVLKRTLFSCWVRIRPISCPHIPHFTRRDTGNIGCYTSWPVSSHDCRPVSSSFQAGGFPSWLFINLTPQKTVILSVMGAIYRERSRHAQLSGAMASVWHLSEAIYDNN